MAGAERGLSGFRGDVERREPADAVPDAEGLSSDNDLQRQQPRREKEVNPCRKSNTSGTN